MANEQCQADDGPSVLPAHGLRFRLVHLIYATAMLSSALATFGASGLVPGLVIVVFWTAVFLSSARPRALAVASIVLLCCFCLIGLLLPAISTAREAARRSQCSNNLKYIALALHNYHEIYGSFPPAYVADATGQHLHSWRVLILPFIEHRALWTAYNINEPWDGPNNRKLAGRMPSEYACPSHVLSNTHTNYAAVVDPRSAWPGSNGRNISEFIDGTSETLLLVETDEPIPWMAPVDLSLNEALRLATPENFSIHSGHSLDHFFYIEHHGRNVVRADASTHWLSNGMPHEVLSALLIIDDGQGFPNQDISSPSYRFRRVQLGNCFRFAVFILLMFLPLPWVWINPHGDRTASQTES